MSDDPNYVELGMVPAQLITGDQSVGWLNAKMNINTGAVEAIPPSESEIEDAEETYIEKLVEYDLLDEEDAEERLQE